MKKLMILGFVLCSFTGLSFAATIGDRAAAIKSTLHGDESYHAYMARSLADVAEDEKDHREAAVARAFMIEAERYMKLAGEK